MNLVVKPVRVLTFPRFSGGAPGDGLDKLAVGRHVAE
jgi:hypothetical protein